MTKMWLKTQKQSVNHRARTPTALNILNFLQFEEEMVDICFELLDANRKHLKDPAGDVAARCNPIYVSRVISAMVRLIIHIDLH